MTRGRKKDLSIPATRSLVQQRDYRARRAQYVSELEERCRRAEEENAELRRELAEIKALGGSSFPLSDSKQVASELMANLTAASSSLAKFQHLVFPDPRALLSPHGQNQNIQASPRESARDVRLPSITELEAMHKAQRLGQSSSRRAQSHPYETSTPSSFSHLHSPSPSSSVSQENECCGGYFNCDDYCIGDKDVEQSELLSRPAISETRNTLGRGGQRHRV